MTEQFKEIMMQWAEDKNAMKTALETCIFWSVATPVMSKQRISIPSTEHNGISYPSLMATEAEAIKECEEDMAEIEDFEGDPICLYWAGSDLIFEINPKTHEVYSTYRWEEICGLK